jgi:hypothetical protein
VICCGLGIVLGAFGATALVKLQGLTIAGTAAIAVALYYFLIETAPNHLRISVSNVPANMTATLKLDHNYPGARLAGRRNQVDFFVVERDLKVRTVELDVAGADGELPLTCFSSDHVVRLLGTGRTTEWQISADQSKLTIDGATVVDMTCADGPRPGNQANLVQLIPLLINPAFAQAPLETIETYLGDLSSEDSGLRRAARSGLAAWGLEAIPKMMEVWRAEPTHYRNALGVVVALTEFLRDNKDQRKDVAALLTDEDFALLIDAIGHPDRTMRIYATEFLFDLGAARLAGSLPHKFPEMSNDGKFNAVFVLSNVVPDPTPEEKVTLDSALTNHLATAEMGERTRAEMQELVDQL